MPPQAPLFRDTAYQLTSVTEHSNSDDETAPICNNKYAAVTKEVKLLHDFGLGFSTVELKSTSENWGYPGHLTESQSASVVSYRYLCKLLCLE